MLLTGPPLGAVERGEPLVQALDELRRAGLQLIYSSALVDPALRVDVDPGSGPPEQIARRILAPHGLTLAPVRPGLFAVVRRDAAAKSAAGALEVRIEQPNGVPIAGAWVRLGDTSGAVRTGADGVARFTDLPPGQYDVVASAPGFGTSALRRIEPRAGETLRAALVLVPAAAPLAEVEVYASRYQVDQQQLAALVELSREDLEALPGLAQDVLRVTRYLPGTASNPVSARTHVRGGRDDELAVFFDGAPLYEPFHFKDVQSLFGILDPGVISTVDFFSGVFPARYGNRLSGVLDIRPRTWAGESYHELGASLLYSHALSQGRLERYPLEWLGAVRYSNVQLIAELVDWNEMRPKFLDAVARLELDLGERASLAAGWLRLDDALRADLSRDGQSGRIDYRDSTAWLTWRFRPRDDVDLHAVASRTERHTDRGGTVGGEAARGALTDRRRFDTSTLRFEAGWELTPRLRVLGGLEAYDFAAAYSYAGEAQFAPAFAAAFGRAPTLSRTADLDVEGQAYAVYVAALVSVRDRLTLDAGLRFDSQRFGSAFRDGQVSPRLALQYRVDPATVLRLSWGRLAQTERPDELQVQDGEPIFHAAQRATQSVVSVEHRIAHEAIVRLEAFDKRVSSPRPMFENLLDPFVLLPELEVDRVRVQPDRSRSYGAELTVRWEPRERWAGWMSYSWLEASDRFGGVAVPRNWDQRNSIAAGLAWTHRPWQLAGSLSWHSGWRRNELRATTGSGEELRLVLGPRNAATWPGYFSLDLRATWSRPLPAGALRVFAEINNATNRVNPCCATYTLAEEGGMPVLTRATSAWLPRYGLIGIVWQLP